MRHLLFTKTVMGTSQSQKKKKYALFLEGSGKVPDRVTRKGVDCDIPRSLTS